MIDPFHDGLSKRNHDKDLGVDSEEGAERRE